MSAFFPAAIGIIALHLTLSAAPAAKCECPVTRNTVQVRSTPPSPVDYRLISCPENTYGYEITVNGKVLIHQRNIPCIIGNKGFSSPRDAASVARLVATKVRKGILPPTITVEEMKTLGIRF